MSFDKDLRKAIDAIDIPEELSPSNIEAMLRASGVVPAQETQTDIPESETRTMTITAKRTNRAVIMRTLAAAAACVALAVGFRAFIEENRPDPIEPIVSEIAYEDIRDIQVQSYDELYNIYTGIYLKNPTVSGAENGDGEEIITDETAITEVTSPADVTVTEPNVTETAKPQETEKLSAETIEAVRSDFSDADIVKSDDRSIYYICGGTLYVVSKDDMAVTAEIAGENAPFEMYVRDDLLVLMSEENASDQYGAEKNVCADIYNIASGIPEKITSYKQNGTYTSSRMDKNGVLYLVTGHSGRHTASPAENAELENYVPGYYIDGVKHYVAAEDISVPREANNTDYTVVSSVSCGEDTSVSVKAVLGSSKNAYCSENTLYVAGTGTKDGRSYTAVTSFALFENELEYKASATLDGELISRYSMAETGGLFRIACRSFDENGMIVTCIYSLDSRLNAVSSVEDLLPGVIVGKVKYDENFASIIAKGSEEPELTVDMSGNDLEESGSDASGFVAAYVNKFSDGMLGISAERLEESGDASLKLEMYDADSGIKTAEISFAELPMVDSPALTDKKAMLIDEENNIIGIPVSGKTESSFVNQYYVFGYTPEDGFIQKGVIELTDIGGSCGFERAVVSEGVLIIVGNGKMVSVQLSDMTVIDTFDFQ